MRVTSNAARPCLRHTTHRVNLLSGALLSLILSTPALEGQEWARFHGPNGTGIGQAKSLPAIVTDADLNWKVELPGSGHSSPVLWREQLFLTCSDDKSGGLIVVCINAQTGAQLWKKDFALAPFQKHQFNSFASATPALDADRVYVAWNEPEHYFLTAFDHKGNQVWQRDFGRFVSQHGSGASPIVCDGKVILANFQDDPKFGTGGTLRGESSIVAVDAKTGATVWQTPRKTTVVAYSTPYLFEPANGKRALIFNSQSHGICAVDPSNGHVLWEYDKAFDKRSVSSPIIAGGLILGSCGSGGGGNSVTAIKPANSTSDHNPDLAWQLKKSAPYVPTGIAQGDLIWLWSDAGVLTCVSAATGGIRYQERVGGNFFGSPVLAAGHLYCVSTSGELDVVEASDNFNVLSRFALHELCHSTPAVALGKLFVRTEKHLWCFGGTKATPAS
jgi:outer membrane protein assembly factor BamB